MTIASSVESVFAQRGVDVEYIVVDGGSTDGTVDVIEEYSTRSTRSTRLSFKWMSEPDKGMYDAINKGIMMATGDVVGILNADDVLATDDTLVHIVDCFSRVERVETCREGKMGNSVERVEGERLDRINKIDRIERRGGGVECVYADIRFVREGDDRRGEIFGIICP